MAETQVMYNPNVSVSYQIDSLTFPSNPIEGDELFVTSTGDHTGTVIEQWIYDGTQWFETSQIITNLSQNTSTSKITYINEAGTIQTAQVVSEDIDNAINVGSDGGALLNPLATTYDNHYVFGRVKNVPQEFIWAWSLQNIWFPDSYSIEITNGTDTMSIGPAAFSSLANFLNAINSNFGSSPFVGLSVGYYNISGVEYIEIKPGGYTGDISLLTWTITRTSIPTTIVYDNTPIQYITTQPNYQQYQEVEQFLLPEKVYTLTAPIWNKTGPHTTILLSDGHSVGCDHYAARVPLVDQDLIDQGELFIEYGRVKGNGMGKNSRKYGYGKGSRVNFWSPLGSGGSATNGRGYSAGGHSDSIYVENRQNLFQVSQQGFIAPELRRDAFYKFKEVRYYNGSDGISTSLLDLRETPHMMGCKIKRLSSGWFDLANYEYGVEGGIRKRIKDNQLRDLPHMNSVRFARLVRVKNGRVVQQGPLSEPLLLTREGGFVWDEQNRRYIGGGGGWKATLTIGKGYKD